MNVGDQLGLDDGSELLEQARQRWDSWVASDDRLAAVVEEFDDLREWLATADRGAADDVLLALAMLAAPDGGDDVAAAAALAKCLLPGACRLAAWLATQRRHMLPGGVELATELVASQLWIEVRTFPWRRGKKVAANILMNTRAGVLRECGDLTQVARTDQTWGHTELVEAFTTFQNLDGDYEGRRMGERCQPAAGWRPCLLADPNPGPGEQHSPLEELREVLAWACEEDVIDPADRFLLLCLVEEASQAEAARAVAARKRAHRVTRDGGRGGLLANDVAVRVAPRVGVSEATVRRRASKSVRALAAAVPARFTDDD